MKTGKLATLAIALLAVAMFGTSAYCFLGGADPSRNMGNYRSFSFYADRPANSAAIWMQPGVAPPSPWDEFWFDNSGSLNLSGGLSMPGPVSIGTTYLTVNSLAQLTADANFNGTVYLAAPVTLTAPLTLTCDLRPLKGAIITRGNYSLTIGNFHAGCYQCFNPSDTGTLQFTTSVAILPQWFGAAGNNSTDDTAAFAAWGTAIQTRLLTGQIAYPEGVIPGGDYQLNSMPIITNPVKIVTQGTVTLYDQGTGVFWSVQNANSSYTGPSIQGPIYIHTHAAASIVFQWSGTCLGSMRNVSIYDSSSDVKGVGIEIRDGITSGGTYGNTFDNVTVNGFGTNWRLKCYHNATYMVTANTFLNCNSYVATTNNTITEWLANTAYSEGQLVVAATNMDGKIYECTTPGTSGSAQPTWSNASVLGSTLTDGSVTWTRVSWGDPSAVPSPGILWLMDNAIGNTWTGGDNENSGTGSYEFAWVYDPTTSSAEGAASFSNVQGVHVEDGGSGSLFQHHQFLVDSATTGQDNSSENAINYGFTFLPGVTLGAVDYALPTTSYPPPWSPGCRVLNPYSQAFALSERTLSYGSGMVVPNSSDADWFTVAVPSGQTSLYIGPSNNAFTWVGQQIQFTIKNQTSGTITVTWDASYKQSYTPPAMGKQNTIHFVWNGNYWVQDRPQSPDI